MISTKNYSLLPNFKQLKAVCKAISVLDAIISQEWEYRYYSYNAKWGEHEECFEMRDGSGDHMLILFCEAGCVINGIAHEYKQPDKAIVTEGLPAVFNEFIFGEPVQSLGTTFCLWTTSFNQWQSGPLDNYEDGSEDLLNIFDDEPQTYIDWASDYFEEGCKDAGISLETVTQIYEGQPLTKAMVLSVVNDLEDWELLRKDLDEIGYPYDFA